MVSVRKFFLYLASLFETTEGHLFFRERLLHEWRC